MPFGSLGCLICFDLNFEELRIRYRNARPDLLVFSSVYHGGLAQSWWAYDCQTHFVGAVSGLPCQIRNPFGEVLYHSSSYPQYDFVVGDINLDCCMAHLDYNGKRLKALKAHYGSDIHLYCPSHVGSVLITSRSKSVSARAMAEAFEVELLDDYMARVREHRAETGVSLSG